jgi:hypothetical protein
LSPPTTPELMFTASIKPFMSNPNAPLLYVPLTPVRVIDTRDPNLNPWGHRLEPGNYLAPIATRLYDPAGIPASAAAYALNITVVPATQQDGFLSAYPANLPDTVTSTLDFLDRQVANSAVVAAAIDPNLGADRGTIGIKVTQPVDLIIDVFGYYVPLTAVLSVQSAVVVASV